MGRTELKFLEEELDTCSWIGQVIGRTDVGYEAHVLSADVQVHSAARRDRLGVCRRPVEHEVASAECDGNVL